jgi:hypothetical protein
MANYFEIATNLQPNQYVSTTSRYNGSTVCFYGQEKKITFTIYQRQEITESENDKYMIIPPGYEYRPDLVSYNTYGIPDYWWLILQANKINDVYGFKTGLNIRLPFSITQLS